MGAKQVKMFVGEDNAAELEEQINVFLKELEEDGYDYVDLKVAQSGKISKQRTAYLIYEMPKELADK